MTSYTVTKRVSEMVAAGRTVEQISDELRSLTGRPLIREDNDGAWCVTGRDGDAAIDKMVARVRAAVSGRPANLATDRQVAYLARLLRDGEAGYMSTRGLVIDGRVQMDALRRLSKRQASALIDSLTDY